MLGKECNNTDSDMFSIGPAQGYIRRYTEWKFRVAFQYNVQDITDFTVVIILLVFSSSNRSVSVYTVQL